MAKVDRDSIEPKMKQRRGYSSVDAIDPADGKIWQVLLPHAKMDQTASRGEGAARELGDTVRWVLLHPKRVYRGVRFPEKEIADDDWLCYVATPHHAYDHRTAEKREPWVGEVFLVFVTNERVVYLWYWTKCDGRDPHLPEDYENRFLEQVL